MQSIPSKRQLSNRIRVFTAKKNRKWKLFSAKAVYLVVKTNIRKTINLTVFNVSNFSLEACCILIKELVRRITEVKVSKNLLYISHEVDSSNEAI